MCACGATDKREIDKSLLWSGSSTQVSSGGYWFTYADHIAWMAAHPDQNPAGHTADQGATIEPLTDMEHPLTLAPDPDATSGHGDTVHIVGLTPPAPAWTAVTVEGTWFDTYYQQPDEYPDSLNVAYPVAGAGFGFVPNNDNEFDPTQGGKYVGLVFDMKTRNNTYDVDVQVALVCSDTNGNDLHDDAFGDAFAKPGCTYAKAQPTSTTLEQLAADYFSGPNSYTSQTCFAYQHRAVTPVSDNQWSTYCVLWNEMTLPSWAQPTAQPPAWSDENLQKCATKLKWEMYKPTDTEQAAAFDVYLDNVKLITRAEAEKYNCDTKALPSDPTRVIGPPA
jgi:hypothetical protein